MKRLLAGLLATLILLTLVGCQRENQPEESGGMIHTGPGGEILTGWQIINGAKYCFTEEGLPVTGWISAPDDSALRYYLDETGRVLTGWQDIGNKRYYFGLDGAMTTGWAELDGSSYYFGIDGAMFSGLLNIQGQGYYFLEDGRRYSGWLDEDDKTYYFGENGVMAVGPVEIDGVTHYFSPRGVKILLVNPWNMIAEDYQVELVNVTERDRLEKNCAENLVRMLEDCRAAGYDPVIVSAYRTQAEQEYLYNRKVSRLMESGLSYEDALNVAARSVAVPGTSEHQLGLAVDIIDSSYGHLDEHQANTPAQKWLMEHCHEYGFILRYPVGSTEITGIVFEPWHYRYVGLEIAQEIMNLGITLEEYLGAA